MGIFGKKKPQRRGSAHKHIAARKQKANRNRFNAAKTLINPLRAISKLRGGKANKRGGEVTSRNSTDHSPDRTIMLLTFGLSMFGLIMVYSGSFYVASNRVKTLFVPNNPFHFFLLQVLWLIAGTIAAYIAYRINYKHYKKLILPGLLTVLALLIIVLLRDEVVNGAKSWILIGPFSLQPSEFAKPLVIIYLAAVFSKPWQPKGEELAEKVMNYIVERFLPFALVVGPLIFLTLAGRDLVSAGIIGVISLAVFFFADNQAIHNWACAIVVGLGGIIGYVFAVFEPYRRARLATYLEFIGRGEILDPTNTGYQLNQILIAVGSGGLFGFGFGQSRQKYFYLQETAFSDTIFAVVAEEFGLFGSLVLIFVLLGFLLRGLRIATRARDKFGSLMAFGVVVWFATQVIIHLGVNVGLLPLTGITLPFLSYGGSSLITCLIGVGILLNVSKGVKLD